VSPQTLDNVCFVWYSLTHFTKHLLCIEREKILAHTSHPSRKKQRRGRPTGGIYRLGPSFSPGWRHQPGLKDLASAQYAAEPSNRD
jgi:hypothetical protein